MSFNFANIFVDRIVLHRADEFLTCFPKATIEETMNAMTGLAMKDFFVVIGRSTYDEICLKVALKGRGLLN